MTEYVFRVCWEDDPGMYCARADEYDDLMFLGYTIEEACAGIARLVSETVGDPDAITIDRHEVDD
jgi:hypothetical protein